ncbi:TPA: hypothetical protein ACKSJL_001572 [Providencia stuartii]|uniref:hypothetical protein n=1 Tax=Providencia stuartii TaxID=588 RepID=UPI000909922E|nr:hypothetical protein [Providencia stuartii]APG52491.1 hypothetical protein BGK56_16700 [Providencia stuartii]SUC43574.1 Uncharacterised protein [Providencia stuartii]
MSKPTGKLIRITPASIGAVPVGRKVNNKPLSADISLSAGDVGAYDKIETDTKVADAKKVGTDAQNKANAASTAATNANNNANGRVPNGRKVNGKPLTADITLSAGDVGAFGKTETYNRADIDKKIGAGSGFGYGQKWQDFTSQRKANVVYQNTTGKPIAVFNDSSPQRGKYSWVSTDSISWVKVGNTSGEAGISNNFVVPVGHYYKVESFIYWSELR